MGDYLLVRRIAITHLQSVNSQRELLAAEYRLRRETLGLKRQSILGRLVQPLEPSPLRTAPMRIPNRWERPSQKALSEPRLKNLARR